MLEPEHHRDHMLLVSKLADKLPLPEEKEMPIKKPLGFCHRHIIRNFM